MKSDGDSKVVQTARENLSQQDFPPLLSTEPGNFNAIPPTNFSNFLVEPVYREL